MEQKDKEGSIPYRNRNHSGWWVASYIIGFEIDNENKKNLNRKCLAWENTILIQAEDREEAYRKSVKIGKFNASDDSTRIRKYGKWHTGRWVFEGLTSLLPIYEEMGDGCEILWAEYNNVSVRKIKAKTRSKKHLECFDDTEVTK